MTGSAGSDGGDDRPPPYSSASAIVGDMVTGHHLLTIEGYSCTKEKLPNGKHIKSKSFTVGDHQWRLRYYPNGVASNVADYVSVFLEFAAIAAGQAEPVNARAKFSVLDQAAGKSVLAHTIGTRIHGFTVTDDTFGFSNYIKREVLEESEYLRNDKFTIPCDVTVVKELHTKDRTTPVVQVPPPELHRHLGGLLESKEGVDVTFHVAGEDVHAHQYVLAARSPVFKAELFGPMKEGRISTTIRVDDMEAEVFRSLLAFIYTDTLPETKTENDDDIATTQHLLVAADRYGMERLTRLCEEKLCKHIDRGSEACFRFIDSPETLKAVMATDGFDHLTRSCPFVVKELIVRL
uniref:BTB domain-containing protein n=1 Tax=Leersia perrieri TaxID=77586 RepID=A0A0D9XJV6_9ORYZ